LDFKKIRDYILSDKVFMTIVIIFIITMAIVTCIREGKDLKVGLFGVTQVLHQRSPYDNPTDTNRPIFRYAPGFTILQAPFLLTSKLVGPFEFEYILPSVFLWYLAEIIALLGSVILILKLIPAPSHETASRNLRISVILAMPLVAYELSNCQNKLMALAFVLLAVYMFEKKKEFLSAVFLSIALTIYIPLLFFAFYFIVRSRGRYMISLALAAVAVFLVIPSLIWGIDFNNFLLKDWYIRCLKPFFMTTSYATYMELRASSQSLPSAVARIFVSGKDMPYKYLISPTTLHILIRMLSTTILVISLLAVWRRLKPRSLGLSYALFLPLALIMPSYCIWYTWAWLFVIYYATLNYLSYRDIAKEDRKLLTATFIILLVSSYSIAIGPLNHISVMFWGTLLYWGSVAAVLIRNRKAAA